MSTATKIVKKRVPKKAPRTNVNPRSRVISSGHLRSSNAPRRSTAPRSRPASSSSLSSPAPSRLVAPIVQNGKLRKTPLFGATPSEEVGSAYGSTVNYHKFAMAGDMFKGVKISVCQPMGYVSSPVGTAVFANRTTPGMTMYRYGGGSTSATSATMNGTTLSPFYGYSLSNITTTNAAPNYTQGMSVFDSPVLHNVAGSFSRYRVTRLAFHYERNAVTSSFYPFVFSYTADTLHPNYGLSAYLSQLSNQTAGPLATTNPPISTTLDGTVNSVTYQPWMNWSMDVPVDNAWKYMAAPATYNGTLLYGYYDPATLRDTQFGFINNLFAAGNGSGAIATTFGRLWIDMDIEMSDPSPVNIGLSLPYTRSLFRHERAIEEKVESKEEPKEEKLPLDDGRPRKTRGFPTVDPDDEDDGLVVSPPAFTPTPSAYPGSAGYRDTSADRRRPLSPKKSTSSKGSV